MSWSRFFRRNQWDRERAEELGAYLEIETEENIARGMSAEQARESAHRKLGNPTLIREEIYHMNSMTFLESLWQDVRYSLRTLAKARAFTFVVIASLALGIGANTAIFSLINAALLKMLPVKNPGQLVQLKSDGPAFGLNNQQFSYQAFKQFRDRNRVFSGVLAFRKFYDMDFEVNGQSGLAKGQVVSGNYFSVLGIEPVIGRLIIPADDNLAGQNPIAVISYDYWRTRFALDPAVIGKKIVLNNSPFTIIGVTPPEFFGLQPGDRIDVSVPVTMIAQVRPDFAVAGTRFDVLTSPIRNSVYVMARLKSGVTKEQAMANLEPIYRQVMRQTAEGLSGLPFDSPAARQGLLQTKLWVDSAGQGLAALRQQFSKPLWILMAAVALLLLVTCANVANLLLARANARQKEIAVRLSVGAGRWRTIRQLITESVLLASGGGILGLLLAFWASRSLLAMISQSDSPISLSVRPDGAVLGFTLLVSLLTALLFGFMPAWRATQLNSASALVESTRSSARGGNRSRLGKLLIISQVALSLILLIGAGLLGRSLQNLKDFYPGFNKDGVLLLSVNPLMCGYNDAQLVPLYQRLLDRFRAIPGVRLATFSVHSPLTQNFSSTTLTVDGYKPPPGEGMKQVDVEVVGPEYFKTMETPVLVGQDFTAAARAGATKVAIVNEALARHYFGDANPIGRQLSIPGYRGDASSLQIIAVVKDAKYHDLREQVSPEVYIPAFQFPESGVTYEIRTATNPVNATRAVLSAVKAIDSRLPVFDIKTLNEQVDDSLVQERLVASLSGLFGLLALTLAAVGLFGLMTYVINRRTGEIGIRMALGATRKQIAGMVLRETLLLVFTGLVIGIPLAIGASKLITNQLHGLKADDPITILIASLVMASVAALAGYIPARRASRVDPMAALRCE